MTIDSHSNSQSLPAFLTDHLALAAFLVSRSHPVTLVPSGSDKILLRFAQAHQLSADAAAFSDGSAQVEPATYDAARITLRQKMDALKGGAR